METAKTARSIVVESSRFPHRKNAWHHIAVTYSGRKCAVYLNGIKTVEADCMLSAGSTTMTIGAYSGGYAYGFRGDLSALAVYDKVISDDSILAEAQGINPD